MISATEIRRGMVLKLDNHLYTVVDMQHITPGNWRAIIQTKLRDIISGAAIEQRFSSGDKVEVAYVEQAEMEYLYMDGDSLVLMNQENYDQIQLHKDYVGDAIGYLKENIVIKINYCDGKIVGIELPHVVELKVMETDPPLKGATVTNVYKPAKTDTGITIAVPPFVQIGDVIRVDTRDGKYLERVNK